MIFDIYTLGAYISNLLQNEEMNIFRDFVILYNENLKILCKSYSIKFVDTENVGKKYNNSENNFHISTVGHNALASYILENMYQNKIEKTSYINNTYNKFEISNNRIEGVISSLCIDHNNLINKTIELTGYEKERQLVIAAEHKREIKIFQKIRDKNKTIRF